MFRGLKFSVMGIGVILSKNLLFSLLDLKIAGRRELEIGRDFTELFCRSFIGDFLGLLRIGRRKGFEFPETFMLSKGSAE